MGVPTKNYKTSLYSKGSRTIAKKFNLKIQTITPTNMCF